MRIKKSILLITLLVNICNGFSNLSVNESTIPMHYMTGILNDHGPLFREQETNPSSMSTKFTDCMVRKAQIEEACFYAEFFHTLSPTNQIMNAAYASRNQHVQAGTDCSLLDSENSEGENRL